MKRNISIVDFVTDPQLLGLSISQPQETGCIRETKIYDGRQQLFVGQRETRF